MNLKLKTIKDLGKTLILMNVGPKKAHFLTIKVEIMNSETK